MAGFYAQVVLYSVAWRDVTGAAGESAPYPGAPAEWTADQLRLWALQQEYRAIAQAVAIRDGQLPDPDIMEDPGELRSWFERWLDSYKDEQAGRSEWTGYVIDN